MTKRKVITISNRLPVKIQIRKGEWKLIPSEGGLATGLKCAFQDDDAVWIGWPGTLLNQSVEQSEIDEALLQKRLMPVWLSQKEINHYYEGFSNETLWPLFHYFSTYAQYHSEDWQAYLTVNKKFADAVLQVAAPNDIIWVHDYHLLLLPGLIRDKLPQATIGFFQHIPFPSYELFRLIPWRAQLLDGMLGSDLIGFHTYDDERHFMSAVQKIRNLTPQGNELQLEERIVMVDAFPMGIDYKKYHDSALAPKTRRNEKKIRRMIDDKKMMLSIDRLDYSKGIIERLEAYAAFLKEYPEFQEKVVFIQLIVPSRDKVQQYAALREEANQLVSEINGRYGSLSWQPIYYFYRSFPLEMISALYAVADVALVAPLRDGMNLVCKEYIASKTKGRGVLILSEMAGASKELYDALLINPNDQQQVVKAIYKAFTMPYSEREKRMRTMQQTLKKFNIRHWVNNFMDRLATIKNKQQQLSTRKITEPIREQIIDKYSGARKRLLLLDYDGTLIPFNDDPMKATPDAGLYRLLENLYEDPLNYVVLISGRDKETLAQWFGTLPIDLVAEHGVWIRPKNSKWSGNTSLSNGWKAQIASILKQYEMLTPGSFIEEKTQSLAWHYRKADVGLGERRAQEIISNLEHTIAGKNLQILEGNRVIEIKSASINKGKVAKSYLKKVAADFILAVGDDITDEDTFAAMPATAITIKIGAGPSGATYFLKSIDENRALLAAMAQAGESK